MIKVLALSLYFLVGVEGEWEPRKPNGDFARVARFEFPQFAGSEAKLRCKRAAKKSFISDLAKQQNSMLWGVPLNRKRFVEISDIINKVKRKHNFAIRRYGVEGLAMEVIQMHIAPRIWGSTVFERCALLESAYSKARPIFCCGSLSRVFNPNLCAGLFSVFAPQKKSTRST